MVPAKGRHRPGRQNHPSKGHRHTTCIARTAVRTAPAPHPALFPQPAEADDGGDDRAVLRQLRIAVPRRIVLDIDDTEDRVHGRQQLSLFHAHYDSRCFLPIHLYEATSGKPVAVILQPGNIPRRCGGGAGFPRTTVG